MGWRSFGERSSRGASPPAPGESGIGTPSYGQANCEAPNVDPGGEIPAARWVDGVSHSFRGVSNGRTQGHGRGRKRWFAGDRKSRRGRHRGRADRTLRVAAMELAHDVANEPHERCQHTTV